MLHIYSCAGNGSVLRLETYYVHVLDLLNEGSASNTALDLIINSKNIY